MKKLLPSVLLVCCMTVVGWAAESPSFDDLDRLIDPSDLIVQGHVSELNQGLRQTDVTFEIERVFKGDPALKTIKVTHQGGKHVVVQTEPEFMSYDKAILFLEKRGEGNYACTDGVAGKKTIRNDNVYTSPDNSFLTIRLNVYQDAIAARLKAREPLNGAPMATANTILDPSV